MAEISGLDSEWIRPDQSSPSIHLRKKCIKTKNPMTNIINHTTCDTDCTLVKDSDYTHARNHSHTTVDLVTTVYTVA